MKDWHQVLASVVTVAGGLLLVWWQTNDAVKKNEEAMREFQTAVRDSDELRGAVIRPLEGRWDYAVEWDVYFNVKPDPLDRSTQYFASGIADIHWRSGFYQLLLGYEISSRDNAKHAVSVNTGSFPAPDAGVPPRGTRMEMSYSHRLGLNESRGEDEGLDYSQTPENRYAYEITDYELDDGGRVQKILARFEVDQSKGDVVFTRIH